MLTVYVPQTQTSTENIRDIQSTSYDIASGETKGFLLFLRLTHVFILHTWSYVIWRLTHVFILHILSSHLPLFSLQSVPSCLDSTTLCRVRARLRFAACVHTHTHRLPTHSLTRTHTHTTHCMRTAHKLLQQRSEAGTVTNASVSHDAYAQRFLLRGTSWCYSNGFKVFCFPPLLQ